MITINLKDTELITLIECIQTRLQETGKHRAKAIEAHNEECTDYWNKEYNKALDLLIKIKE